MFLTDRLEAIEEYLSSKNVSLESSLDFSPEERIYLGREFNIRFKISESGCFCYYSTKPGAGGFGKTPLEAFCYLLTRLQFKRSANLDLLDDLAKFFQQLK